MKKKKKISGPNVGAEVFLREFYLEMLHIVASYNCMQSQGKRMIQTQ